MRFNRAFWQRLGPEVRLTVAWDMVQEAELIKGKHAGQSRLQRSIQHIQCRTR